MIRNHRRLGDTCGDYPAASGFAAEPYRPLTPDENARYLAAAAIYNACKQTAVGAPQDQCPAGSSFQGGFMNGVWQGKCVSTFTGQPTTDLITASGNMDPAGNPIGTNAFGQRGSAQSAAVVIGRPIAQGGAAPAASTIQYGPNVSYPAPVGPLPPMETVPAIGSDVQGFLDSVPNWAKWGAAAAAAYFFLFRK